MIKVIPHVVLSRILFTQFLIAILLPSCKKFLDVGDPPDKLSAQYVYRSNVNAIAVLNGIYYDLQSDDGFAQGRSGIGFNVGLSADEFKVPGGSLYQGLYSNDQYPDFWGQIYGFVYRANAAIEDLSEANSLSPLVKRQLLGEAFFIRAFCYLVNLYGDVPLITSTDYKVNANLARTVTDKVYEQIIMDLTTAHESLSDKFVGGDLNNIVNERIRPTKWAAAALLARSYLYMGRWREAEQQASEIINQKDLFDIVSLDDVFLRNSREAIWQIQQISGDGVFLHVRDAELYILANGVPDGFANPVSVGDFLMARFGNDDKRKFEWLKVDSSSGTKYWYFYKYKTKDVGVNVNEYLMVFRLAEQYLIRAEARAQLNDLTGSENDLNLIRGRAGLQMISVGNKDALINAIFNERQVELFTEWGHRWFDLKRMGKIDSVMAKVSPAKGGTWASFKRVYPIPKSEFQYNKNLQQNEGYPSL